jgi:hypothetical protein
VLGRLDACRAVQALQFPDLVAVGERYDGAGRASPRGPAGPVQIVLVIVWRVEVDHKLDAVNMDPARRDIGGDQNPRMARGERIQGALPLILVPVSVDRSRRHPGAVKLAREPVSTVLRADEEQRPGRPPAESRGDSELVSRIDHQRGMLGRAASYHLRFDRMQGGICEVGADQPVNAPVEGGGEQQPLAASRSEIQNAGD